MDVMIFIIMEVGYATIRVTFMDTQRTAISSSQLVLSVNEEFLDDFIVLVQDMFNIVGSSKKATINQFMRY